MEIITTQLEQNVPNMLELHEQDLKEIERIKAMVAEPNDENLTNPQPFMAYQISQSTSL